VLVSGFRPLSFCLAPPTMPPNRRAAYAAALAAGGKDNGAPGPRDFAPNYYAAFVIDPDGNNIEAACRGA